MSEGEEDLKKWVDFYYRLRKEYEDYKKTGDLFTYELDLTSSKPKPKAAKFMVIINKFVSIYKWGLKQRYDNEEDFKDNYWSELNKNFHNDFEMGFINGMYFEKPKNKIKKYFAILIHTKRIFQVLDYVVANLDYLYKDIEMKRKNYAEEIKYLDFLKDGQYRIMGQMITSYDEYADERNAEQKIKQKQRLIEEQARQEEEKLMKAKQQEERLKRQKAEKMKKQEEDRIRNQNLKIQLAKQQNLRQNVKDQPITPDYFPSEYKAFTQDGPKKMRKDSSTNQLEIPTRKYHEHKLKNSEKLFIEGFKDEMEVFTYNLKPEISEDKSVCAACGQSLKTGIYMIGGNQNLCYYTGKWYCNNDIAEERMSIPWKAIEDFDLRGFAVCKVAYAQLKSYYEKPIIEIPVESQLIKKTKKLYQFLIVKRQIHLIYDSICNLDLIEPLMKNKLNYCLKRNIFSMRNLYDIYNGQETNKLERDYQILSRHFYRCEICQKKKGYICPICKDPVKIFPFELKETHGCKTCRKLYHRKCLFSGNCECKQDEEQGQ